MKRATIRGRLQSKILMIIPCTDSTFSQSTGSAQLSPQSATVIMRDRLPLSSLIQSFLNSLALSSFPCFKSLYSKSLTMMPPMQILFWVLTIELQFGSVSLKFQTSQYPYLRTCTTRLSKIYGGNLDGTIAWLLKNFNSIISCLRNYKKSSLSSCLENLLLILTTCFRYASPSSSTT